MFIEKVKIKEIIISITPFAIVFALLLYGIYNNLDEMLVPVIIYGLTISLFGTFALYNYSERKSTKSLLFLIGACVFIASDATIAINKFLFSRIYFEVFIMVTYALAQYFICKAMLEEKSHKII